MERKEFQKFLLNAEKALGEAGIESPAAEVAIILEHILEVDRLQIYLHGAELINDNVMKVFQRIVERRKTRHPLQYILGETYFYGRRFFVDEDVMIPTPETELLCELAINYCTGSAIEFPEIIDIGTGSGVIAVTLSAELTGAWLTAVDKSQPALAVARQNAARHGVGERIQFLKSDLFSALDPEAAFDLILSNPPYIAEAEYPTLPPEVKSDPKIALLSGVEGLDTIKELVAQAPQRLKPGGRLMFEIGYDQTEKIAEITKNDSRYRSFSIIKDLNDIDRVIILSI